MQTAWIAAEACKIKDGVFMGNVMAVQDSGFILSNKICTVIKCQKGFTVPKRLRNAGVQYSVINLLEAFLDDTISDDTKDHMLEGLYADPILHCIIVTLRPGTPSWTRLATTV